MKCLWIVCPPALYAAHPVGATITSTTDSGNFVRKADTIVLTSVLLPDPACLETVIISVSFRFFCFCVFEQNVGDTIRNKLTCY